jgi:deaminated glutathione amidase
MQGRLKIAAVQMVSTPEVARNLDAAARGIAQAAAAGAALVVLPEYFCLMGHSERDKLAHAEPPWSAGGGPIQHFLSAQARQHGLWLLGGTLPVRPAPSARTDGAPGGQGIDHARTDRAATGEAGVGPPERVLNRSLLFGPGGQAAAHYDKIHLFSFASGNERYDEGRTLSAGSEPVAATLDTPAGPLRLGLSICYDLRFPELYRALMHPPCDLIAVPAAFTHTTGRAHWELLLRARAVENQCYVVAAAQGGTHENGRRTWGHSLIADPWGEVLACVEIGEGVAIADIDAARLADVRERLPALAHRQGIEAPTLTTPRAG